VSLADNLMLTGNPSLIALGLMVVLVIVVVVPLAGAAVALYTDWLWFHEVGYASVFETVLGAKALLGLLAALLVALLAPTQRRVDRTILLGSHALGSIEKLCDEAIWLDKGRIQLWDEPHAVVEAYTDFLGVREEEEDPVTMEDV
jgi:hypothetical protein